MAIPTKLEFKQWIEDVRAQIDRAAEQSSQAQRNTSRVKRGRTPPPAPAVAIDFSAVTAVLDALSAMDAELLTRMQSLDQLEAEFHDRSVRLDAAAQQLEQKLAQLSASGQLNWDVSSRSSDAPEGDETNSFETASSDNLAHRIAQQLSQSFASGIAHQIADEVSGGIAQKLSDQLLFTMESAIRRASEITINRQSSTSDEQCDGESETRIAELQDELNLLREANSRLQAELVAQDEDNKDEQVEGDARDAELIAELQAEIQSLQETLLVVRSAAWQNNNAQESSNAEGSETMQRLTEENADLREQNADLATQLARLQMSAHHNTPHLNLAHLNQESMTWEQRKRLILQQLENESADASEANSEVANHRNEVEAILRTTQAEIDRRDQEIAELKSIVEQQSNTREGLAIGAAAIAQMIDSDELVRNEREKLAAIQQEWESKLREAEIEMSLERAKLSRERAELEEQLRLISIGEPPQSASATNTPSNSPDKTKGADGKPVRRWLEHLGLRDNK